MALHSNLTSCLSCTFSRNASHFKCYLLYNWIRTYGFSLVRTYSNKWKNEPSAKHVIDVGDRSLLIKSGHLARFADGAAVAEYGDTAVLVTAVSKVRSSSPGFLPLTVDYRQKAAAAGRIPTNFLRRELGPSDKEILTSRMIDRSIRPLFPPGYHFDTQLMCNLLSVDGVNDPDILSINAASAALCLSDIPWDGPIGAVRVGLINDEVVINPTRRQLQQSQLNLVISGCDSSHVVMMEGTGEVVTLEDLKRAVKAGIKATETIVQSLKQLQESHGRSKREYEPINRVDADIVARVHQVASTKIKDVFNTNSHDKISRDEAIASIRDETVTQILDDLSAESNVDPQQSPADTVIYSSDGDLAEVLDTTVTSGKPAYVTRSLVSHSYNHVVKDIFRDLILDENRRCDGRELGDLRDIACSINLYKSLHGSALFQRGQTQVLSTVTFDSPDSAAKLDTISAITSGIKDKNFMLHYEFPPYATNEMSRPGAIGRRELGHGSLAEKGLKAVIPDDFPFTIRLTCEVLESNGSSSMASVCGGSLALMDAGVKISKQVAGVAVGLVTRLVPDTDKIDKFKILTDISGIEDYMGDMDFKMAGTKTGMTSLQMDTKLAGLPVSLVMDAMFESWQGRKKVLAIMNETINAPKPTLKDNSPVVEKLEVPPVKRSRFAGLGGYNLKKLRADTGVSVTPIDETTYQVFAPNSDAMTEAREVIETLLAEEKEPTLEFGCVYNTRVVEIKDYGVMVEIHPRISPVLLHNSQLDQRKIKHPSVLGLEVGSEISAKYFGRDPANGQIRLSRKVLFSPATNVIKSLSKHTTT